MAVMVFRKQKSGMLTGWLLAVLIVTPAAAEPDAAEIEFWQSVKETTAPAELEAYLEAYPQGDFAPLARIRLKALKGEEQHEASEQISPAEGAEEPPPIPAASDEADDKAANPPTETPPETSHETSEDADAAEVSALKAEEIKITLGVHPSDPTKGLLGVKVIDATPGFTDALGVGIANAALVSSVVPDSAADKDGVKPGHLIIAINGAAAPNARAVEKLVAENLPGAAITLKVIELASTREALEALLSRNADSAPEVAYALANITQDSAKVAALLRKAAEQNYVPAMFDLADRYDKGRGVAKDGREAAKWYRKAADKKHAKAAYRLSSMYARGHGVEKDASEAVKWKREAADLGVTAAMFELGLAYSEGNGVERDRKQATEWFRKAADQGSAGAMSNLGYIYEYGEGVAQDFRRAAEWYRKGASHGQATAKNNLGLLYDKGNGVQQDSREAARLLLEAYRSGNAFAKQNLEKNSSALHAETRREIQRLLKQEGVYTGAIDGDFGPRTIRAIEKSAAAFNQSPGESSSTGVADANSAGLEDLGLGDLGNLESLD